MVSSPSVPIFRVDTVFLILSGYPSYLELHVCSLRKHAYSNTLNILPPKNEFSDKNSDIFNISAQNIDCGYLLEPPL